MKQIIVGLSILILSFSWVAESGEHNKMNKKDNTEMNKRDRRSGEVTSDQQSNSSGDMEITRRIREDIMDAKNFSTYAQNVKVITVNGKVTLKGPVQSEQEKNTIAEYARMAAGPANVSNELSVLSEQQ